MSLSFAARQFIATGYKAALALEQLSRPWREGYGMAPVDEAIRGIRWPSRDDEARWRAERICLLFDRWRLNPDVAHASEDEWQRAGKAALALLKQFIPATIGKRETHWSEAFLILLYVSREMYGDTDADHAEDYAPWLGTSLSDVEEMVRSKELRGLVESSTAGGVTQVRISFDGRKQVDKWLHEEPEPPPVVDAPARTETEVLPQVDGFIDQLELRNVFSFGPALEKIELGSLNLLIGPNGAGKTNILDVIELLASTPRDLQAAVREAGGIGSVLSKNHPSSIAWIDAHVRFGHRRESVRHLLVLGASDQRFEVVDERILTEVEGADAPTPWFGRGPDGPTLFSRENGTRRGERIRLPPEKSILSERRDPLRYPVLADLAGFYEAVRPATFPLLDRRDANSPRRPQPTDAPNDRLVPAATNLALVVSRLRRDPETKARIIEKLKDVYASVRDVEPITEGGTIQLFLQEEKWSVPATRISDGTLRFLCLLVLLCDPSPPPLIMIEEPELGLHPDAIGAVADLLREASEKSQLIVTTHSVALVDRFNDMPEAVQVVESENGATKVTRQDPKRLKKWLEKFSLGRLWRMGELGGNRW